MPAATSQRRRSTPTAISTKLDTELSLGQLYQLRDEFLNTVHGVFFYSYQRELSDAILAAVFQRTGDELYACVSRQGGKTETLVRTLEFLFVFHHAITGRPIRVGIFAPQQEQAKTDFDRVKDALVECAKRGFDTAADPDESNATTLKLLNARQEVVAICYALPLTETSKIESKTLDLAIFEEAHQIDDRQREVKAIPMLAHTNGVSVSVGVGGYRINAFYRSVQAGKNLFFYPADRVCKLRREAYEADGNEEHLNYEKHYRERQAKESDPDALKTQYLLQWVLGAGQFCVRTDLEAMVAPESFEKDVVGWLELRGENYSDQCEQIVHYLEQIEQQHVGTTLYVGVDSAKHPDSTVVTVGVDAFDDTSDAEANRGHIAIIAFDATGQGDFMPDWFERNTRWKIERLKFGPVSKDELYKRVQDVIHNQKTRIPARESSAESERFWQQFLDLQKQHSAAGLLRVSHPDSPNAHDDYPDSFALMEHAYWVYNESYSAPGITIL